MKHISNMYQTAQTKHFDAIYILIMSTGRAAILIQLHGSSGCMGFTLLPLIGSAVIQLLQEFPMCTVPHEIRGHFGICLVQKQSNLGISAFYQYKGKYIFFKNK